MPRPTKKSSTNQPKKKSAKAVQESVESARQELAPSISPQAVFSKPTPSASTSVSSYRKISLSFLGLTLIMVLAIFYFTLAKAEITIIPKAKVIKSDFKATIVTPVVDRVENITPVVDRVENSTPSMRAVVKTPVVDRVENTLQGKILAATVELRQTFPASQIEFEEKKASGEIIIINNYSRSQALIKNTRLLSSEDILFRTDSTVKIPAYSQMRVNVYADKSGPEGEIGPTRFTIPGLWPGLQDKIYGESKESMTGGLEEIRIVTDDDIEQAKKVIEKGLIEKALKELASHSAIPDKPSQPASPGALAPGHNDVFQLTSQEILETIVNAKSGDRKDEFEIAMKLKLVAIAFDEKEMLALVQENLKDLVPQNLQLLQSLFPLNKEPVPSMSREGQGVVPPLPSPSCPSCHPERSEGSSGYELVLDTYNLETKTATLKVYAQGQVIITLNNPLLNKNPLIGKNEKEVKSYLEKFPEIESVEIKFSPFWVRSVPILRDHIEIEIKVSS